MPDVYLVCGVSGSGKSWVCRQLKEKFSYVPHDRCWTHPNAKPDEEALDPKWGPPGSKSIHVDVVSAISKMTPRPILTECPFAERKVREELEAKGLKVIPVFVIEPAETVAERYQAREGKPLPKAAFTRASSILDRAKEWSAFHGTANQVLEHLRGVS